MFLPRRPVDPDLLLSHATFVRRMARALMRNEHDAEDLVQETYAAALDKGPKESGPLRPWLTGVLKRRAADAKRRRLRREKRERRAAQAEALDSVSTVAERAELGRQVVAAVMRLKEPNRTAVLLRHHDGLPPRKIAAKLGVPVETVRTRVRRGMAEVRASLAVESGGSHRPLGLSLALLARPRGTSTALTLVGVAAVKKVILVASLLIGGVVLWQFLPGSPVTPPAEESEGLSARPELLGAAPDVSSDSIPLPTGAISGVVTNGGVPAAAHVDLLALPTRPSGFAGGLTWMYEDLVAGGAPVATVRASAEGQYSFADVATGHYELRARLDGRLGSRTVRLPAGDAHVRADVALATGDALLHGRAVYADGRPFQGLIRVHRRAGLDQLHSPLGDRTHFGEGLFETDKEGRFEVRGVARGPVVLAAFVPGRSRYLSGRVQLPHEGEYVFTVDQAAQVIEGDVVRAAGGAPVPGALVILNATQIGSHRSFVQVRANAQGHFRAAIPGTDVGLQVRARGFADAFLGATTQEPITGRYFGAYSTTGPPRRPSFGPLGSPVRVRMVEAGALTGRVLGGGAPVPGVTLHATTHIGSARGTWQSTTSDESGRYRFESLAPGEVVLFAAGGGWLSRDLAALASSDGPHSFSIDLPAGETIERDLAVVRAARMRGHVLDPQGAPVQACLVYAAPAAAPFPTQTMHAPVWLGTATTNEAGAFEIDTLLPGYSYRFYAQAAGHPVAQSQPVFVAESEPDPIEIRLAAPTYIEVRVVDKLTRKPVTAAGVRIGGNQQALLLDTWHTDGNGVSRVGPIPASQYYAAFVEVAGYLPINPPMTIEPRAVEGAALKHVEIEVTPAASLAGVVTAPAGAPLERVHLQLYKPRKGRRPRRVRANARVAPDGQFRFAALRDEAYLLRATLQHGIHDLKAEVELAAGERETRLELTAATEGTNWVIRITGADGRAVSTGVALIFAKGLDGSGRVENVEFEHGVVGYRYPDECSEATVSIYGCRDESGLFGTHGVLADVALPPEGGEVDLTLSAGLSMTGSVTCEGEPVGDATIRVVPTTSLIKDRDIDAHAVARTRTDGTFVLVGLGDLPYSLRVDTTPQYMAFEPVELPQGERSVTLELQRGIGPLVMVLDPKSSPASGVRVALRTPGEPLANPLTHRLPPMGLRDKQTRSDGRVRFRDLEPGRRFDLHIAPVNQRWAGQVIRDWTPSDVTIRLEPAYSVEGVVVDEDGKPVLPQFARLWVRRGPGPWTFATIGRDGTFKTAGLSEGEQVALAATEGSLPPSKAATTRVVQATAGARGVRLVVRAGSTQVFRIAGWNAEWNPIVYITSPGVAHSLGIHVSAEGVATATRLDPERTYACTVPATPDGRYGYVASFQPSEEPIEVSLQQGATLEGKIESPPLEAIRTVQAYRDGFTHTLKLDAEGRFRMDGMRPGTWTLRVYLRAGGTREPLTQDVETGVPATIILGRKR